MRTLRYTGHTLTIFITLMLVVSGCNLKTDSVDTIETSYKVLSSIGLAYDTAMHLNADAYAQGLITQEKYEEIKSKGEVVYNAYQAACAALLFYHRAKTEQAQAELEQAVSAAQTQIDELIDQTDTVTMERTDAGNSDTGNN